MRPCAYDLPDVQELRRHGDLFTDHFILSRGEVETDDAFDRIEIGGFTAHVGPDLDRVLVRASGMELLFLGVGVDRDGAYVDHSTLKRAMIRSRSLTRLADYLCETAGRYCVIVADKSRARLYLDPSGTLPAVFAPEEGTVASVPTLAVPGPVEPSDYPYWSDAAHPRGARFAFGVTADRRVTRLLANHYLDLGKWTTHRHWPGDELTWRCDDRAVLDSVVRTVVARHEQVIGALAARRKVALPVSGGQDSRLLLGFASRCAPDIDLAFTHVTNQNTRVDARIAGELCSRMGMRSEVIDVLRRPGDYRLDTAVEDLNRRMHLRQGYLLEEADREVTPVRAREIAALAAVPRGSLVLRGHVTDISKAVLWRDRGARSLVRDGCVGTNDALALMQLEGPAGRERLGELAPRYEEWLDTLPAHARSRSIDFMGTEQYRSTSLGTGFHGFEGRFFIAPGNDRLVIRELSRISPALRQSLHVNDLMLARTVPQLADVRYVRTSDNERRRARKKVDHFLRWAV